MRIFKSPKSEFSLLIRHRIRMEEQNDFEGDFGIWQPSQAEINAGDTLDFGKYGVEC
jgi:hypothetical protein